MKLKHFAVASLAFLLSLSLVATPAAAEVSLGVDAASTFQSIETTDNNGNDGNEEMAFGDPRGNIHIYGDVASGVEAYMEVLLNPTATSAKVDVEGDMRVWQGYLTLTDVVPGADVKLGNFEPDFGAHRADLSVNGRTMDNEFVTNQLVAPVTTETGLELSGALNRFAWSAAVTNGMESDGMGNVVAEDSSLAYNFRVWGNITPNLTTSLSYYASDQSDASITGNGGGNDLFGDMAPNSTVLNDSQPAMNDASVGFSGNTPSGAPANSMNAGNPDLTAYQLDLGYEAMGNSFSAYYGVMEDASENLAFLNDAGASVQATGTIEWSYYSLEAARDLTPQTYVAARYGAAESDELDVVRSSTGPGTIASQEFNKISVGLGHSLNENTLAKLEYVQQENDSSGSDAEYSGVIGQLAVNF